MPETDADESNVVLTWQGNGSVTDSNEHRIVCAPMGNEYLIVHQMRRGLQWDTKDTWEAGDLPVVMPHAGD